jgi:hypothetical protein
MRNLKRTYRRRMVIAAAVLLGLTPTALSRPAQARPNPGACQSDDDWDKGHTARGWCYGGREKDARRYMRLYVVCEGDPTEHSAPFNKTMYIRMGYRMMPVPAAEYKCGPNKVKSHRVGPTYA